MRIFLTGASGFVGFPLAAALAARGHAVAGLVRRESASDALRACGVEVVEGELSSLEELSPSLDRFEAFVHTAQARTRDADELDGLAVDVFTAQRGYLLYTSSVWVLPATWPHALDEMAETSPLPIAAWRAPHEEQVLAASSHWLRTAVIRPGTIYGGRQSLLDDWFTAADQGQPLRIIGDGHNHWAMVDIGDLVNAYVRAIEQEATGILHAVDDTVESLEDCARAVIVSGGSASEIEFVSLDDARRDLGPIADALAADQRIASLRTRTRLGWEPTRTFVGSVAEQWAEWRREH